MDSIIYIIEFKDLTRFLERVDSTQKKIFLQL